MSVLSIRMFSHPLQSTKFAVNSTVSFASVHNYQSFPAKNRTSLLYAKHSESAAAVSDPIQIQSSSQEASLTVSFLINSCGLSPETATHTSRNLHLKTLEKPESVLTLFKKYNISKTQIANIVRKRPSLLLADPQKTIYPKLEFLKSIGVSDDEIGTIVSRDPAILARSLKNHLIPIYKFLKSVLKSNAKVVGSLRRRTWIFGRDHTKYLAPNIDLLRKSGVSESCIMFLLAHFADALICKPEELREVVMEVLELGFDPTKTTFVLAIRVLTLKGGKLVRDRCCKLYKKWGWSDDEIQLVFKKHPHCMIMSEVKITKTMEFLVNDMGWQSSEIARFPTVLFYSLEKRIIPRCRVIQVLLLKGVVKMENVTLTTLLMCKEALFLKKFVTKYENQVPKLLDLYQGKLNVSQL